MEKLKHTPGPWKYQEESDNYTHIVRFGETTFMVQLSQDSSGISEANARLIAAAPEMLEALITVYDVLFGDTKRTMIKSEYRDLIEKATGMKIMEVT